MFKKQCLIVALISINATTFAMDGEQSRPMPEEQSRPIPSGANINSAETNVHTPQTFVNIPGPNNNTFHTHQQPTFTAKTMNENPVVNAALIIAKAAAEGSVQGIFQGAMQGVGSVIAQKIIATLNEPVDERDARQLMSKNQQIVNLSSLRDEVNNFYKETSDDEELAPLAHKLRLGLGHTLLAFIERQKKEDVCIVTPLLHKVQNEVNAFAIDTKDQEIENLRKKIQKNYGLLIHK